MSQENKTGFITFTPRDSRIPRVRIFLDNCPKEFLHNPEKYANTLFEARITRWKFQQFAFGIIVKKLGESGELKVESDALLRDNDLHVKPFTHEELKCVPKETKISKVEFLYRKDLRMSCIFTIDPATARDLDDAVSCRELEDGSLEVGVHISDVAYYLQEGTPLDKVRN